MSPRQENGTSKKYNAHEVHEVTGGATQWHLEDIPCTGGATK